MKIKLDFTIVEFSYVAPIQVLKNQLIQNKALRVSIKIDEQYIGELALTPLPHFHHYTLEEWRFSLKEFFEEKEFDFYHIDLEAPFFNTIKSTFVFSGELLFAIESVLFLIIEKKYSKALAHIEKKPIHINALYSSKLPLKTTPNCLKIKIRPTPKSIADTITIIKKSQRSHFRLDGNRSFDSLELKTFLLLLKKECGDISSLIEYIEEPFKNSNDLFTFKSQFTLALDESLIQYVEQSKIFLFPNNFMAIIKPSLIGISKSFFLMEQLKERAVISSTYESSSAMRPLMYLAAINPRLHHGLDTFKFLPKELCNHTLNDQFCLLF